MKPSSFATSSIWNFMKKKRFKLSPLIVFFLLSIWGSRDSYATEGFLMTPDGVRLFYEHVEIAPEKEIGTVVLLHGWGMSYTEWAGFKEKLQEEGWSTMAFDFRGHGASIEAVGRQLDYRKMNSPHDRKLPLVDIRIVMEYLTTRKPIWMVGSSLGANYAIRYAASDKRIGGVVLIAPGYDSWKILARNTIGKYGSRPIMVIAARNNPWSFQTSVELREKAAGPKSFYVLESGHDVEGIKDKIPLAGPILDWMNKQTMSLELGPGAKVEVPLSGTISSSH